MERKHRRRGNGNLLGVELGGERDRDVKHEKNNVQNTKNFVRGRIPSCFSKSFKMLFFWGTFIYLLNYQLV